jgi:hypothetical protein
VKISTYSIARAGLCLLTASAVVIALTVQPAPPPKPAPTVQLTAIVQPTALPPKLPLLTVLLNSPLALLGPAAPLGTGLPPAPTPQAIPIAPNLADSIDSIYISVEPWVQYGFEVATAVVRWIPYVGWFAGLIMDGYFFVEGLVASGVFNFTDWLRGAGGIVENLVDFGIDVGLAFVWLGLDALNSFIPLPPFCCYPPRPPAQGPFLASTMALEPTETVETLLSFEAEAVDQVESLGEEDVVTEEDVTEEDVVTEEEFVTEEDVVTEKEDLTEEVTPEVTDPEVTDPEVTAIDKTTTDSFGNIEAQGEIRGAGVDLSIDEDAEAKTEDGTDGVEGANGADGVDGADAEVETAEDTDEPTETTDATTAGPDTGEGNNDSGTE